MDSEPPARRGSNLAMVAAVCCGLGLSGCKAADSVAPQVIVQPISATYEGAADPSPMGVDVLARDGAVERAIKAGARPEPVLSSIDWSEAATWPALPADVLTPEQAEVVSRATLPVLLPADPALLRAAQLTLGDRWYGASIRADSMSIAILGSRQAFRLPEASLVPPNRPLERSGGVRLSRRQGSPQLAFQAFGAAYWLTIECDRPFDDRRCTEDDTLVTLAEGLHTAGEIP